MIEVKWIMNNEKIYKSSCEKRGVDPNFDSIKSLYEDVKKLTSTINTKKEEQNKISKEFPLHAKDKDKLSDLRNKSKSLAEEIKSFQEEMEVKNSSLTEILALIPNILDKHVPYGNSDKDNEVFYSTGVTEDTFEMKNHFNMTPMLNFERSAKISGPRFSIMNGDIAKLYRALSQYMLDFHQNNGVVEYIVPTIVKEETMFNADKLPKFADDAFLDKDANLWFIPTSEVPLVTQFSNEFIEVSNPIRMTALTSCYRKEAGSAGRDTRGLIRQHQFDKVELVTICKPSQARDEFITLLSNVENLIKSLGLGYRKLLLCSKDTGFGAAKTIDFEVYFKGAKQFREISSCSMCNAFQATRSNIKYKEDGKNNFVHTMNGSGLPIGRTLAAIMEHYQTKDNEIIIPDVLKSYMNKDKIDL